MDDDTRDLARRKLDAMNRKVGYPDFLNDVHALDEHYEQVRIRKEVGRRGRNSQIHVGKLSPAKRRDIILDLSVVCPSVHPSVRPSVRHALFF